MVAFIIRFRWLIIFSFILLGIGFGLLIPFAKTDPDIRNYVPAMLDSRVETDLIEKEFGVQDMVVILFSDSCILNKTDLNRIKETDHDLSRLTGVSDRISPFTVRTIKGSEGMIVADRLVSEIPSDSSSVRILADEIVKNRFARDIVFSSDLTTASISATINTSIPERQTLDRIDSVINRHSSKASVLTGGLPYVRKYILQDVRKDGLLLVPAALIIMLLMLKLTLGDWRSLMMPFSVVIISTLISMGLISLLGWKMSILTLLVPVLLVAVANNYGIYLVARHQEISRKSGDISKKALVSELLKSLNMPILFSGLTTIAGILGLLTHSIIPARQVGVLAATGVSLALLMSLVMIPAMIYIRGAVKTDSWSKLNRTSIFDRLLSVLSQLIVKYPGRVLLASAVFTMVMSLGIFLLRIDTNQEDYFPKHHPVRAASNVINSKFGGSQRISVMVNGDIKSPEIMKGIDNLTNTLENLKGVGRVFSISQVVREMSKALFNNDEPEYDMIPDSREAIAQMFELYNMSGDKSDFSQIINLDNTRSQILISLTDPDRKVIREVKEKISEFSKGFPATLISGGYAVIMSDFAVSVIKGQVSSLLFALVTVLILLAIIFRSIKGGLTGSIPLAASILILFGFMGLAGIALDAATALLSSIMIGVGVDFTIQYIWCFNNYLRSNRSYPDSITAAYKTIGRSIIINAVSVMAGFSALMFSGFASIRFFGYLVIISIGSCLAGALIVIPAFLMRFRPGFAEHDFERTKRKRYEKKSDLIGVAASVVSCSSPET
jgi:uncharacterized protein